VHYDIESFSLEGTINETALTEHRERLILWVESDMRDRGFVPVLDLEPVWSAWFDGDRYQFKLTIYGVDIGRDEAWTTAGLMNGKRIPRHTVQPRSSPASTPVE
jgi:hypothetical protein